MAFNDTTVETDYPKGYAVESTAAPLTRAQVAGELTYAYADAARSGMVEYPANVQTASTLAPRTREEVRRELAEAVANPAWETTETDYPGKF